MYDFCFIKNSQKLFYEKIKLILKKFKEINCYFF